MKALLRKTMLFALVSVLAAAAMPFASASAAGDTLTNMYDPLVPASGARIIPEERLERIWARQLRIYQRIGHSFEHDDEFVARVQGLIDRAKANGKDVSDVQTALDAFEAALKEARPVYESARGIVNSHQGFDGDGKVINAQKAQETVDAMRGKFKEIKDAMGGTGRALHESIRAFREANPRLQSTSAP
jgi:hypothetical protein